MNDLLAVHWKKTDLLYWLDALNTNNCRNGQVLVFYADQNEFDNLAELTHLLNSNEHIRFEKLFRKSDKRNFLISRLILKAAISQFENMPLKEVILSQEENEKPFIVHPESSLNFSLSHAKDYVLVGISFNSPIGVDIEQVRASNKIELIASAYFSEQEQKLIRENAIPESLFFDYWTRKEAVVKLIGLGLLEQIRSFEVCHAINYNTLPVEISHPNIFLNSFIIDDYQACVALTEDTNKIMFIHVTEELIASWLAQ